MPGTGEEYLILIGGHMVIGKSLFLPVVFIVVFKFLTDDVSSHLGTFCRPLLTNIGLIRSLNVS